MTLPVDMQQDEHVIMRVRRHIFFLLTKLLGVIVLGVIPLILLLALATVSPPIIVLAAIWGVITFIAIYFIWYRYQHDEWIVTNQRLIDSLKKHWFHHHLISTDLINIENMSVLRSGVFQTVLNYGDLRGETAGHQSSFVLSGIPDPSGVLDTVDTARDEARQKLGNSVATLISS